MSYSERQGVTRPRDQEEIGEPFWGGFVALVRRLIAQGFLAESFPLKCEDGGALVVDGSERDLMLTLRAELPDVSLQAGEVPNTLDALDAVEFFAQRVTKPTKLREHAYLSHSHIMTTSRRSGLTEYRRVVNRLLERCGHTYEVDANGEVQHIGTPVLKESLASAKYNTGDDDLDTMLSVAVDKFKHRDPAVRVEALEKLWDAFERLKTLLPGDKKQSATQLLSQAVAEPKLRAEIEAEAKALTGIGNNFMIRHSETDKTRIDEPEHVEYLFHRLFALVFMILRATGRASV